MNPYFPTYPYIISDTLSDIERFDDLLDKYKRLNIIKAQFATMNTGREGAAVIEWFNGKLKEIELQILSNSKQPSTSIVTQRDNDTNQTAPEPETTEQKIKRILEPLRGAFDTTSHIDKIVKALAEFSDSQTLPGLVETKIIQINNPDFYPYFKKVKNETRLTVPGIALVLKYFICKNNGTGGDLEISTIEKNIKLNYKIVPE